ncbi:MAG TPA: LytTR family DNA-binding domain-containing protein [Flavisolibacter sp.]|nr:LytTR family DNA-binding domain-containing protein [Flavisolibacter sp.]
MTTAVIIEDEKRASDHLASLLMEVDPDLSIVASLASVSESIDYLSENFHIDLIFSDVQLADGLSFNIFSHISVCAPVIFVTGYDRFMLNAFESNGIDYLLKPVSREDLHKALIKYRNLKKHFSLQEHELTMKYLMQFNGLQKKSRIVVRKGFENISLLLSDVVLFYTENKITYVIDKNGKKYMSDKNLTDLEKELDDKTFFRASRQYILNINYIKGFKTYERVKLWVELTLHDFSHSIIISQETAPHFRKWILEA